MKNITSAKLKAIKNKNYCKLIMCVFCDNIENYVFPKLSLNWKESTEIGVESSVVIEDAGIIYLIQNYKNHANLYILLPTVMKKNIPLKADIESSLNKLNINDQLVWFNDWWYLPESATDLKNLIMNWVNENIPMVEIKLRTLELTRFSELEVKNLLTSHNVLVGSNKLDEIY
jgi:hypothetical protein